MTPHPAAGATLLHVVFARTRDLAPSRVVRVASVIFITALTAAAAQVTVPVPFTPVPFTFQPTIVLLGGLVLGARLGSLAQLLYLAAGVAGVSAFSPSVALPPGAMRLIGPTGGYLLAYPLAAFVVGRLAERGFDRRYATSFLAMVAGLAVIYMGGAAWLAFFARTGTGSAATGLRTAIATGVLPFVLPDLVKLIAAAGVAPVLWRVVGNAHRSWPGPR
jgi:biotin transport system substrate-specific component